MSWGTMFSRYDRNATNLDSAVTRVRGHKVSTLNVLLLAALLSGNAFAYTQAEVNQVITPQEARVDQYRNAEIQQLQVVLSRSGAREKQPDLLLRLAELYTEKYRLYFMKENELWSKQMEAYMALPLEQQKGRRRPVLENATSKQWLGKAVEVLGRIPQQKESYERIDEVYYFLGFNQWELGKKKQAADAFENIVEKHPKSRFAPEAYRYLGDFAFANRDFTKSRTYYERAAKTDTPARARVLYGLGWSQFKLHDYKRAVNTMREAITTGRNNAEAAKAGVALQRDAAESLALFYSEGGDVDKAVSYFGDLFGETESLSVLRKLGQNYQSQGKYAKALAINKQLLEMGGAAAKEGEEQRFSIMVDNLNVAISKGDRGKQAALLTAMTGEFVTNSKEPEAERLEILKTQVRKAATFAHREGNQAGNAKAAFQRAEELYRLYLSAFARWIKPEDAAEVRFYLTDVLTQLGRHREAAAEYKAILDLSQSDPAYKKYGKDSAINIIYSLDAYFKQQKGAGKALSKSDADQIIGAIDSYLEAYPNDKQAAEYLARATGILVVSGRMDEARPRLNQIIAKYPKSPEAWDAASSLLKETEQKKDYAGSEELAKHFLANPVLMAQDKKGEFRKQLESIASRAQFQAVRKTEENKDFAGAAAGYEKLADAAKDDEVRRKSLTNAAVSYAQVGDKANELRIYKKILQRYPGNDAAEKAIIGIANEFFLSGNYSEAAEVFESFYKLNEPKLANNGASSQKLSVESLRSAALLRRALRQGDKAAEDFKLIVDAANKGIGSARDAAGEFLFDMAKRFRDEGNAPEAIKSFQKYASAFPNGPHVAGANMEAAILYFKLKEEEKAQNYLSATISKVKAKGNKASQEELGYAAQARLELLGPLEASFENSGLHLPEARLKKDINDKLAALERLKKGYAEVMDFGDGNWGVEAFRRQALAYRSFAQKLERAPIPNELSPEDKAKFKAQLKAVAAPVYQKVAETLDTAVQKGEQLQVVGSVMANTYVLAVTNSARADKLPLIQSVNWENPREWIMGDIPSSDGELETKRKNLRTRIEDVASWVAIGNYHLLKGEEKLGEIFYLYALQKNPKYVPALNNLAYLRGREGDMAKAMAGFKAALGHDEFAVAPKKNSARIHMASGLWRHASLQYRQLEVRSPNDKEVKRGLALASLATGKSSVDASLISQGEGNNGRYAEGILALAKGDRAKAAQIFESLKDSNEYAKLILDTWNTKESQ